MIIAIDYDRTYTRAPDMWAAFGASCIAQGHEVVTVTKRRPDESIDVPWTVHYTSRTAKGRYVVERGLRVDVWVDDDPMSVYENG